MPTIRFTRALRCASRLLLLVVFVLAGAPRSVQAQSFTLWVDTTEDTNAEEYRVCSTAPGDCSLRGAISKAKYDWDNAYTIELAPGETYLLTLMNPETGGDERENEMGDLNINSDLVIQGRGATIDAQWIDRVMSIHAGSRTINVTLNDLTLTNGAPNYVQYYDGLQGQGGGLAVFAPANVTLNRCVIKENSTQPGADGSGLDGILRPALPGGRGGGIFVSSFAKVTLNQVLVENNQAGPGGSGAEGRSGTPEQPDGLDGTLGAAGGCGGGIYSEGELTIIKSTIRGNRAGVGGMGGWGGQGQSVEEGVSELAGNGGNGGAAGPGGDGGGICAHSVTIRQSLIADNQAGEGGEGGPGGYGGHDPAGSTPGHGGDSGTGGQGGSGGGVAILGVAYPVPASALTNVTLYGNAAGQGGVSVVPGPGGQSSAETGAQGSLGLPGEPGNGGGLSNAGADTTLNFLTITANEARSGGAFENLGTLYARNSILAANHGPDAVEDDCRNTGQGASFVSDGYNLFGSAQQCNSQPTDQVDLLPGLELLADNGGPTQTAALSPGSPALEAASCTTRDGWRVGWDQRGYARPAGPFCDVGAYQATMPPPLPTVGYLPLMISRQ